MQLCDEWKISSRKHSRRARVFESPNSPARGSSASSPDARVAEPADVFERVVDILQDLADKAGQHGLIIGIENDHACNISTAQETAGVLAAIDHSNLQVVWDPASAYISGEKPFPSGYKCSMPRVSRSFTRRTARSKGTSRSGSRSATEISTGRGRSTRSPRMAMSGYIHLETYWAGHPGLRSESEAHGRISGHVTVTDGNAPIE